MFSHLSKACSGEGSRKILVVGTELDADLREKNEENFRNRILKKNENLTY